MAIWASRGSSESFAPAPVGVHQAVCVDVVDLGVLEVTWGGQTKKQHKVKIVWQIEELMETGKPFLVSNRYTLSLHEKSRLRADLQAWRGKPFTEDESQRFDLETLIGVNCLLNVIHKTSEKSGAVFANIAAIMPLKKGMPKIVASNYRRVIDRVPEDEQTPSDAPDEPPPITDDDIPF